jgi:hypothetical protein
MVIVDDNMAFSRDILTSGKGDIVSYTPFNFDGTFSYRKEGYSAFVMDRIPPIVVNAMYNMDEDASCGDSESTACDENIIVYLSEFVYADKEADPNFIRNPFSYCFEYSQHSHCSQPPDSVQRHNQLWRNDILWQWEQSKDRDFAYMSTYMPNKQKDGSPPKYTVGVSKGDSIVRLNYYAYKLPPGGPDSTTRMPKATDWVKLRSDLVVFRDAEGNTANPREIGVLIDGKNRYRKEHNRIGFIDPSTDPADPDATLGGVFSEESKKPYWISEIGRQYARSNLFKPDSVAEFLPIIQGHNSDSTKRYYPGSVGTIFDIATNINTEVNNILDECNKPVNKGKCVTESGKPLDAVSIAEGITFHANVFYHTNIGNYTADRRNIVSNCTDFIFRKDTGPDDLTNNCYSNRYNFYLAWDLKDNKNRYVGAGAYVAVTNFYWQIKYLHDGTIKAQKYDQDKFVEMFGVTRGKAKKYK